METISLKLKYININWENIQISWNIEKYIDNLNYPCHYSEKTQNFLFL